MREDEAIALFLVAAGLVLAVFAPRIPRNPVFGLRVGYSFYSQRVWTRVNRELGVILALLGVSGIVLGRMGASSEALGFYMGGGSMAAGLALIFRAKKLAELESLREPEGKPGGPGSVERLRGMSVGASRLVLGLILVGSTLYLGGLLVSPLGGWGGSLWEALALASPYLLVLVFEVLARMEPMFFYNPWVPPRVLLVIMVDGLLMLQVVLALGLAAGEHYTLVVAGGSLLVAAFVLLRLYVAWTRVRGRRHEEA